MQSEHHKSISLSSAHDSSILVFHLFLQLHVIFPSRFYANNFLNPNTIYRFPLIFGTNFLCCMCVNVCCLIFEPSAKKNTHKTPSILKYFQWQYTNWIFIVKFTKHWTCHWLHKQLIQNNTILAQSMKSNCRWISDKSQCLLLL